MPYIVIDKNTGEIKEELSGKRVVALEEGDRVVRKASIEYFKNNQKNRNRKKFVNQNTSGYYNSLFDTFTKVNVDEMRLLLGTLDVYECSFLFSVLPYVGYLDCKIRYDNGKPLYAKDFARLMPMSMSKIYKVISSLEEKCIICKYKGAFYVNPWIFSKGVKINRNLKGIFADYLIRSKDMTAWIDL